ncbi:MAG: COG1361 S-layer family protein [Mobilitalea sp.]
MRMKKLLVAFLVLAMMATTMIGKGNYIQAESAVTVITTMNDDIIIKPGEMVHIKLPIQAVGKYIDLPSIETILGEATPFTISKPKLTTSNVPAYGISVVEGTFLEFDVKVQDTAGIDGYPVDFKFTRNYDDEFNTDISCLLKINFRIIEEKIPAQLTVSDVMFKDTTIGTDTDFVFTIKNEGEILAKNVYVRMNYGGLITENYTAIDIKVGDLAAGDVKRILLPISILPTATIGRKTIVADFTYKTVDGTLLKTPYNIYIDLKANEDAPELMVKNIAFKDALKPGEKFSLDVSLINEGETTAKNITITVDDTSVSTEGILKNYFTDGIWVPNMKVEGKRIVEVPLAVSKYATSGLKTMKVNISYTDDTGVAYTISNTIYIDVVGENTSAEPNIVIRDVKQSPAHPIAGEKLVVSFYVENKSQADISELKISTSALTGNTFIPMESEPYQYIEKLEGGKSTLITIPLIVSDTIPEGLNNLTVNITYAGMKGDGIITIPVIGVLNESGSSSKPKLIVSKYVTDVEELRAGSTFNFTFDLKNTNSSVAAKNITITVTQADNIYSVTQGSNSFYIDKIGAGETVQNTLQLKVKSDASTKAYPLKIVVEYEYDGIEANPTTGEIGESKTEELNLQAVENSRPVVDYVNVYSFDGNVITGNPATLAFEFYNMGRSPLNNVIATVEGDFTKSDGNMYFIGNVVEGSSTYAEFEVIPNIEGTAKGVLKITYEDSNGDEVEFLKEFEAQIMGAGIFDPGIIPPGGDGEVFNPEVPLAKKAIVPIWAFVIIQIISFLLFMFITRKIIISAYKTKLRNKEQEQY